MSRASAKHGMAWPSMLVPARYSVLLTTMASVMALFTFVLAPQGTGASFAVERGWELVEPLPDMGVDGGSSFGSAVAMSGNVAVVGAPGVAVDGVDSAGAVSVLMTSSTAAPLQWQTQAVLHGSQPYAEDARFGCAVAIDLSLGAGTIAVSECNDDYSWEDGTSGEVGPARFVHMFKSSSGDAVSEATNWVESGVIVPPLPGDDAAEFAAALALYQGVLVAGHTALDDDRGGVHLFHSPGGDDWVLLATVSNTDGAASDLLGASVAAAVSTGGFAYVVAGATGADLSAGEAIVFAEGATDASGEGAPPPYALAAVLRDEVPSAERRVGQSVGAYGDLVVVGADVHDDSGVGYVLLFSCDDASDPDSAWTLLQKLQPQGLLGSDNDARVGESVALSSEVLLVGAPGASDPSKPASTAHGAAVVFIPSQRGAPTGTWEQAAVWYEQDSTGDSEVGRALAVDGPRAMLGGMTSTSGAAFAIAFQIYDTSTPFEVTDGPASAGLGVSVASAGSLVVLGSSERPGVVRVCELTESGELSVAFTVSSAPDGADLDWFGYTVDIADDGAIVVGAPDLNGVVGMGYIYVFTRTADSALEWERAAMIADPEPASGAPFGSVVSAGAGFAVVGVPGRNTGAGAAFLCAPPADDGEDDAWTCAETIETNVASGVGTAVCADTGRVAIGAPNDGSGAGAVVGGAVLVAAPADAEDVSGVWSVLHVVHPTTQTQNAAFGKAVALDGDVLAVGAPGFGRAGAVFIFLAADATDSASPWSQAGGALHSSAVSAGAELGSSIALGGTVAVAGAVRAEFYDDGGAELRQSGAAVVFASVDPDDVTAGWVVSGSLSYAEPPQAYGLFGMSVAVVDEGTAVVGAPGYDSAAADDDGGQNHGAAFTFALGSASAVACVSPASRSRRSCLQSWPTAPAQDFAWASVVAGWYDDARATARFIEMAGFQSAPPAPPLAGLVSVGSASAFVPSLTLARFARPTYPASAVPTESGWFRGVTLQSGGDAAADGGLLEVSVDSGLRRLTLVDCTVMATTAARGGGLYAGGLGTHVTLLGTTFSFCSADVGGALFATDSATVEARDCTFSGNSATSLAGGAVYVDGRASVAVAASTFTFNTAATDGGTVSVSRFGSLSMTGCTVEHGNAERLGGGLFVADGVLTAEIVDCSFSWCQALHGGAAAISGSVVHMSGVDIANAVTIANGGGIAALEGAKLYLTNSSLQHCFGKDGGALLCDKDTTCHVAHSVMRANYASRGGGVAALQPQELLVDDVLLEFNSASGDVAGADAWVGGGAAYVFAGLSPGAMTAKFDRVRFVTNSGTGSGGVLCRTAEQQCQAAAKACADRPELEAGYVELTPSCVFSGSSATSAVDFHAAPSGDDVLWVNQRPRGLRADMSVASGPVALRPQPSTLEVASGEAWPSFSVVVEDWYGNASVGASTALVRPSFGAAAAQVDPVGVASFDPAEAALQLLAPAGSTQTTQFALEPDNGIDPVSVVVNVRECTPPAVPVPPDNTRCAECTIGRYAADQQCHDCAPGRYAESPGLTECRVPDEGFVAIGERATRQSLCPSGSAPAADASDCVPCNAGNVSAAGSPSCTPCVPGTAPDTSQSRCVLCSLTSRSNGTACEPCSAHYTQDPDSPDACVACPDGHERGEASSRCTKCARGKFVLGGEPCQSCGQGLVSEDGADACTACPPGSFEDGADSNVCQPCAAGTYAQFGNETECAACPEGQRSAAGASSCRTCAPGEFVVSSACSPCPAGRFSAHGDAATCSRCAPGSVATVGSTECTPCGDGFVPSPSNEACIRCDANEVAPSGSTSCRQCDGGTRPNRLQTECDACPPGTEGDADGFTCSPCAAGRFSAVPRSTSCSECLPGRYVATTGNTACLPPSLGSVVLPDQVALVAETACTAGTYAFGDVECRPCDPGHVSAARSLSCTKCGNGTRAEAGGARCIACGSTAVADEAATECTQCPVGSVADPIYHTSCVRCPAGHVRGLDDVTCRPCAAGWVPSDDGASCRRCDRGSMAAAEGTSTCTVCPAGTWGNEARTQCQPCAPGYEAPSAGATECTACPVGHVADGGQPTCQRCFAGSRALAGAAACEVCPDGSYASTEGDRCIACPAQGVSCAQGLLHVLPGYWRVTSDLTDGSSSFDNGTLDGISALTTFVECPDGACTVDEDGVSQCAEGREGPLCAVCVSEPLHYSVGDQCLPCGSTGVSWLLLFVMVIALGAGTAFLIQRATTAWRRPVVTAVAEPGDSRAPAVVAVLKILVNFFQLAGLMNDFEVPWPSSVGQMWGLAGAASTVPVTASFVTCTLQLSVWTRFWLAAASPVVAALVLLAMPIYYVVSALRVRREDRSPHWGRYRTAVLVVAYLLYPTVSREVVRTLDCSREIGGKSYLRSDFRVECGTPAQSFHAGVALVVLAVFCVGLPLTTAALLVQRKRAGRLYDDRTRRRLSFLMEGYRTRAIWWESAVMTRKFLIVTVAATVSGANSHRQVYAGCFVVAAFLSLQVYFRPYQDVAEQRLETVSLATAFVSLYLGQLLSFDNSSGGERVVATATIIVLNVGFVAYCSWLLLMGRSNKLPCVYCRRRKSITRRGARPRGGSATSNDGSISPTALELSSITNPLHSSEELRRASQNGGFTRDGSNGSLNGGASPRSVVSDRSVRMKATGSRAAAHRALVAAQASARISAAAREGAATRERVAARQAAARHGREAHVGQSSPREGASVASSERSASLERGAPSLVTPAPSRQLGDGSGRALTTMRPSTAAALQRTYSMPSRGAGPSIAVQRAVATAAARQGGQRAQSIVLRLAEQRRQSTGRS